ncbi:MAG: nucleotidyltransferase domain-containing protein [Gaiellaceae bacterium]
MGRELLPQHERLIARACERFSSEPELLGLIVGGSVAHGLATPSSDLDVMLVFSDAAAAERLEQGELAIFDDTLADYEDGYLDGKVIGLGFIDEVAARGSEPARWAFQDAFVAFSRVEGLEARIAAAAAYPEQEREEKLRDFASHAMLMEWFMREADKRHDRYLAVFAGSRLALYAGRTVLALNRMLYPYHKWFLHELERAPRKPAGLLAQIDALLAAPGIDAAAELAGSVVAFAQLDLTMQEAVWRFMRRSEWNWRFGPPPLEDA